MADDDEIYVDIVPRLDENAANEIETSLKEKFKNATQDIGGDFFDALKNSSIGDEVLGKLGEKLGQAIADPLKNIGDTLGIELQGPLEKVLKQDLGGALDDVVGQLGTKLGDVLHDPLHGISESIGVDLDTAISKALNKDWSGLGDQLKHDVGDKLTDVLGVNELLGTNGLDSVIDKVHNVTDTIKAFKSGDAGGVLGGINALTDGAVQPISDLHDQIKQTIGDTKDLVEEFAGAGFLGSKMTGATGLMTEAAAPVAASLALTGPVEDQLNKIPWVQEHTELPGTGGDWFKKPFRELGGYIMHPSRLAEDAPYDRNGNFVGAAAPQPDSTDRLYHSVFGSDMSGTGGGKSSTTANVAEVEAGSAVVQAGSVSLSGGISLPASITAGLSAGGGHSAASSSGIGKGGAGDASSMASLYSGPSILGKGFAQGGILDGDSPGYDNMIGVLPSGSAVGLEGGEGVLNPRAMSKPGVADLVKSLNNHFDEGTTSVPMDPQNPSLFVPPTQGNKASGGGAPPQQAQLGTGSGAGISGGGIIGAAEQAAVSAAGIAGFGGGAIAAQMAEQEINLAIQKGSQAAAALAAAPFETFGLAGGQMGAPTVNVMGGWAGKLISGALGQMNQIPNVAGGAGSVQPPKQPKQPGADEQPGQGEKVSMGPKGSKDDPMHVNVTNQPQAPQGGVTSAANMTATMAPLTA